MESLRSLLFLRLLAALLGVYHIEALYLLEKSGRGDQGAEKDSEIQIKTFPGSIMVYTTEHGTPFDNQAACQRMISPLYVLADRYKLHFMGPLAYHFFELIRPEDYIFEEKQSRIDAWFPIAETSQRQPQIKRTAGCQCVMTVHVGPYDDTLRQTYNRLLLWAKEHQLILTGDSIEQYLIGSELTDDPQNYVTKIYLPFREDSRWHDGN